MLHQHGQLESKSAQRGDSTQNVVSNITDGRQSPKQNKSPKENTKTNIRDKWAFKINEEMRTKGKCLKGTILEALQNHQTRKKYQEG